MKTNKIMSYRATNYVVKHVLLRLHNMRIVKSNLNPIAIDAKVEYKFAKVPRIENDEWCFYKDVEKELMAKKILK